MSSELVDVALEWLASTEVPNWMLLVALLTSPARWSDSVVGMVRSRFGGGPDE